TFTPVVIGPERGGMQAPFVQAPNGPLATALSWLTITEKVGAQVPRSPVMVNRTPVNALASRQGGLPKPSPTPRKALFGSVVAPGLAVTCSACSDPSPPVTGVSTGAVRPAATNVYGPPPMGKKPPTMFGVR